MLKLSVSDIGISEASSLRSKVARDLNQTIVETATSCISQLSGKYSGTDVDTLFFVNSLPYPVGKQSHLEFVEQVGWRPNNVFFLGGNCTSVLSAINFASLMLEVKQARTVAIVVADAFSDILPASSSVDENTLSEWRTMSSALVLSADARFNYNIAGFETCTLPKFHDRFKICGSNRDAKIVFSSQNERIFRNIDVSMEQTCIELAIKKSGWGIGDDISFIGTNRRQNRTNEIVEKLGFDPSRVFTSRQVIGHTGGSDIIFNLRTAFQDGEGTKNKFVVSSSGLGYQWSTMLLETFPVGVPS